MNIYEKLQTMRCELQATKLKKSGKNTFAGYEYFELGDFLPAINSMMFANKVTSSIMFDKELATLTLIDCEKPGEYIKFTCPMADANLKGCHPVQNLGASITYIRRYLYTNAFEIVEHDALDSSKPIETKPEIAQNRTEMPLEGDKEGEARVEITKMLRTMYGDDEAMKNALEEISGFNGSKGPVKGKRSTHDLKGKWLLTTLGKVRELYKQYMEFAGEVAEVTYEEE